MYIALVYKVHTSSSFQYVINLNANNGSDFAQTTCIVSASFLINLNAFRL